MYVQSTTTTTPTRRTQSWSKTQQQQSIQQPQASEQHNIEQTITTTSIIPNHISSTQQQHNYPIYTTKTTETITKTKKSKTPTIIKLPSSINYHKGNSSSGRTELLLNSKRHQRDLFTGDLGIPEIKTKVGSVIHTFETLAILKRQNDNNSLKRSYYDQMIDTHNEDDIVDNNCKYTDRFKSRSSSTSYRSLKSNYHDGSGSGILIGSAVSGGCGGISSSNNNASNQMKNKSNENHQRISYIRSSMPIMKTPPKKIQQQILTAESKSSPSCHYYQRECDQQYQQQQQHHQYRHNQHHQMNTLQHSKTDNDLLYAKIPINKNPHGIIQNDKMYNRCQSENIIDIYHINDDYRKNLFGTQTKLNTGTGNIINATASTTTPTTIISASSTTPGGCNTNKRFLDSQQNLSIEIEDDGDEIINKAFNGIFKEYEDCNDDDDDNDDDNRKTKSNYENEKNLKLKCSTTLADIIEFARYDENKLPPPSLSSPPIITYAFPSSSTASLSGQRRTTASGLYAEPNNYNNEKSKRKILMDSPLNSSSYDEFKQQQLQQQQKEKRTKQQPEPQIHTKQQKHLTTIDKHSKSHLINFNDDDHNENANEDENFLRGTTISQSFVKNVKSNLFNIKNSNNITNDTNNKTSTNTASINLTSKKFDDDEADEKQRAANNVKKFSKKHQSIKTSNEMVNELQRKYFNENRNGQKMMMTKNNVSISSGLLRTIPKNTSNNAVYGVNRNSGKKCSYSPKFNEKAEI